MSLPEWVVALTYGWFAGVGFGWLMHLRIIKEAKE